MVNDADSDGWPGAQTLHASADTHAQDHPPTHRHTAKRERPVGVRLCGGLVSGSFILGILSAKIELECEPLVLVKMDINAIGLALIVGGAAFLCSGLIFLLPTGRKLSSSEDSSDEGRDKID